LATGGGGGVARAAGAGSSPRGAAGGVVVGGSASASALGAAAAAGSGCATLPQLLTTACRSQSLKCSAMSSSTPGMNHDDRLSALEPLTRRREGRVRAAPARMRGTGEQAGRRRGWGLTFGTGSPAPAGPRGLRTRAYIRVYCV